MTDEILAAGRAGGGRGGAAAAVESRGAAAAGRGGRDFTSRRGNAFASRFPRRLPISKRGEDGWFGVGGDSNSRYNSGGFAAGSGRSSRGGGGRGGGSSWQWVGSSSSSSSRYIDSNNSRRWRSSRSAFGSDSFLLSEGFEEDSGGVVRGMWGERQQQQQRTRRRIYDGDIGVVDAAAAAAARTAADAAAEAAAEAAGDIIPMEDDEWEETAAATRGRRLGPAGGRRWSEERDMYAPMDDIVEGDDGEVWENDRFGVSPSAYASTLSFEGGPRGYNINNRRGGGGGGGRGGIIRGVSWHTTAAAGGGRQFNSTYQRGIIRISNLDYTILEEDLKELFGAVGDVVKVWIDYDRTDRSKGTGGCIFRYLPDAERAIRMYEGKRIEGLPLHLELQLPGGGGGVGGGGDGFNGASSGFFRMSNYNSSYEREEDRRRGGGGYSRRGWRGG